MFTRPVTANEFLYLAAKPFIGDIVIQLIIEGKGELSIQRLNEVILTVSEQVPGCKLRLDKNKWIADAPAPKIIQLDQHPALREYTPCFNHFDPSAGLTCEIGAFSHNNKTALVFRALHAVMDGQGLKIWAQSVFRALQEHTLALINMSVTDDEIIQLQRAPVRSSEPLIPKCHGPKANLKAFNTRDFQFSKKTLQGRVPALVAKLTTAIQSKVLSSPTSRGCVMIPVDLRNDLTDFNYSSNTNLSTANLSLPLIIDLKTHQNWLDINTQILKKLEQKSHIARSRNDKLYKNTSPKLLSRLVRLLWQYQLKYGKYMFSAVVSHVGHLKLHNFCAPNFDARTLYCIPCIMPIAPFSLVISEIETHTEICCVKHAGLWSSTENLINELIELSKLEHLVIDQTPSALTQYPTNKFKQLKTSLIRKTVQYEFSQLAVHQIFEIQAKKYGSKTCILYKDLSFTYSEINQLSNALAHSLTKASLKQKPVGVAIEHSAELIIAILALFKLGAIFVPIDLGLPKARVDQCIRTSNLACILCKPREQRNFSSHNLPVYKCYLPELIKHNSFTQSPSSAFTKQTPAYYIFTSGSTGTPKTVINTHVGLTNVTLSLQKECRLTSSDIGLLKSPLSFDAMLHEIFLPLTMGAKLVIAEPKVHKNMVFLNNIIRSQSISFLFIVPSVMSEFLKSLPATAHDTCLRVILLGGETFSKGLQEKLKAYFPNTEIYNLYGPAEAAITSTIFNCTDYLPSHSMPIGKPLSNLGCTIVDQTLNVVHFGEEGELAIYGMGLGLGYLNQPELTSKQWIELTHSSTKGITAYRTGDLVKQLSDGNLLFLGRSDTQVKMNGVRIELNEIEYHLNRIDEIQNSAVVTIKTASDEKRLIAFYTIDANANITNSGINSQEIRNALMKYLPSSMLPNQFIKINTLPFTHSGKLDRAKLSRLATENHRSNQWSPCSSLEMTIAKIWKDIFNTEANPDDDFFMLGGDSLRVISLIHAVKNSLNVDLESQQIYEHPQLFELIKLVKSNLKLLLDHPPEQMIP